MPSGSVAPPSRWTVPPFVNPRSIGGGDGRRGRGTSRRYGAEWQRGYRIHPRRAVAASHAAVHGLVGERVGVLVFVAQGVGDLKGVEPGDAVAGLLPQGLQVRGVDLVLALDLLDHQLGIGDDLDAAVAVGEGPVEHGEQAAVLGEIVGAGAEKLRELGEGGACGVGNDGPVAGGAGVAARAAIAMRVHPGLSGGRRLAGYIVGEQGHASTLLKRHLWTSGPRLALRDARRPIK